ncbi:MAG: PPOX class F420-dependent oxidoreductase [Acidimicrobiales bacterium]
MSEGLTIPAHLHELLSGTPIAFVTTMRPDGRMSTNPVALLFDGTHVRISATTDRRKIRNLLADDRITLCVVQPGNLNRYVEIRGRAVLTPDDDRSFIDSIAQRYMGADRYPFDKEWQQRVTVEVIAEAISSPAIPMADKPPYA